MATVTMDTEEGYEVSGKLKAVTEERVYAFSGGFPKGPDWPKKNIHTDLEFAQNCGLPARIASGPMWEGYLVELMIDMFGANWLTGGKMSLKFIAGVEVGDTLVPKAVVQSKRVERPRVEFVMDVCCENQHGSKVVVGTATGLVR